MQEQLKYDLEHLFAAYGFILPNNQPMSGAGFSELIKRHYDCSDPRNNYFAQLASRCEFRFVKHPSGAIKQVKD